MPKDYRTTWVKWIAFMEMDAKFRKEFLESLHFEVTRGFDVIVKIANEEIAGSDLEKDFYKKIHDHLETTLARAVWAGYALYLIAEGIDPEKANLVAREETNELGNRWTEAYAKDNGRKLLERVDPIYSLILEKQTDLFLNGLFAEYPELQKLQYVQVARIDKIISWALHNGYFIGILESDLHTKVTPDKHYDRKYT